MPIIKIIKKNNNFKRIIRIQNPLTEVIILEEALILDLEEDVRIMTKEKKIHCKSLWQI
jgi:hypothetical protein